MKKQLNETKVSHERKFRTTNGGRLMTRMKSNPNMEYRWVITDVGYLNSEDEFERTDKFIDKGWNIVYSEERPEDQRTNAPDNDTKNSDRLKPVTKRLRGGKMATLMSCTKEQRAENEQAKADADEARRLASVKSIKKQGNKQTIIDHEVDLDN